MRDRIVIGGTQYLLARENLLPTGARRWAVTARPSQPGDPSVDKVAIWKVSGPNLNSFEVLEDGEPGLLSVDYSTGIDTRWTDVACLGPATTVVDCSTGDTLAVGTTNGLALTGTLNGTNKYVYVIRGREPKKVRFTNWTAYDSGYNLGEAATSILYTKSANATEEISIGMAATTYHVVSAVGTDAAADTASANNEALQNRIMGAAPDRIVGLGGQTIRSNALTGTVTMDASAYTTEDTLAGYNVTPTGFAVDGDIWVLGYDNGPWTYDVNADTFFPIMPEAQRSTNNCLGMTTWYPLGVIIPMSRGLRYLKHGSGEGIGPERFLNNTSPVSGRATAVSGTDHWLYVIFYDEPNDDSYLCAGRPRQPGDNHPYPLSWYVLKQFTDTKCQALLNVHDGEGALTNPAIVGGHADDIFYVTLGRYYREIDDANYRFQTAGILYLTEMRREPGIIKDLVAIELTTSACDATNTVTLGFSVDGGAYTDLSGTLDYTSGATLNGVINTNGHQRLLFVDNSNVPHTWSAGRRVKPRLTFAASANTASPKVEGDLRLHYKARPVMATVYEFTLQLDEGNPAKTVEELQDDMITNWGSGQVLMNEDVDGDSYYVRIESVEVREATEKGGSADRVPGAIRMATVRAVKFPSVAGD